METGILAQIVGVIGAIYASAFFAVIKFILGIYVTVLFVDLVLLVILKGFGSDVRVMIKGMDMPATSKGTMEKKWKKITDRLTSDNPSQYKVAILEADMLINKVLADMRIPGSNMVEKLDFLKPEQLLNREELRQAHQVRNKIIHEKDFAVEREKAKEILDVFENFLQHLELL